MMASLRWIFGGLLILALAVVVAPVQANATIQHNCDPYRGQRFHSLHRQRRRLCPHQVGTGSDWTKPITLNFNTTDSYLYVLAWNDLSLPETRTAIPRPGWDNSPYLDTRLSIPTSPSGSTSTPLLVATASLPATLPLIPTLCQS